MKSSKNNIYYYIYTFSFFALLPLFAFACLNDIAKSLVGKWKTVERSYLSYFNNSVHLKTEDKRTRETDSLGKNTVLPLLHDREKVQETLQEVIVNNSKIWRYKILSLNSFLQQMIGRQGIRDSTYTVYKKTDDALVFIANTDFNYNNSYPYEKTLNYIKKLRKTLNDNNISFFYIKRPFQAFDNEKFGNSYSRQTNTLNDRCYLAMRELSAHFDPLSELSEKEKKDCFFQTDHHWKPEFAFQTFTKIAPMLRDLYGVEIPPHLLDYSQYEVTVYKNSYLGSIGRRVGDVWAGLDDFTLITPRFDTSYQVDYLDERYRLEGDFEDVFIQKLFLPRAKLSPYDHYSAYMRAAKGNININNRQLEKGKKLLIIGDSFTMCLAPFLSSLFKECHIISLRTFSGDLIEYVLSVNPDVVIFFVDIRTMQHVVK